MSTGLWQILIILAIVVILFGPSRIPGLGKSIGEAIRGFKKGISDDDEIDVTKSSQNRERINDSETTKDYSQKSEKEKKDEEEEDKHRS